MRNMSFAMTTEQFLDGSKDVTRRFGWWFLKPGDKVMAVEKAMGLKKGEKIKKLGVIEIVSARIEPLYDMTKEDCIREGFPNMTPLEFARMLSPKNQNAAVNRIEFKRLDSPISGLRG